MPHQRAIRLLPWLLVPGAMSVFPGCGGGCGGGDVVGVDGSGLGNLVPGDLVITEFMADPPGSNSNEDPEWFEIYNATNEELDLQGLVLLRSDQNGDDAKLHQVAREWIVPAQGYVVAGARLDDELDLVPHIGYGYGSDLGNLAKGSGRLAISRGDDLLDDIIYDGEIQGDQDEGVSFIFSAATAPDAILNDDLSRWCSSFTPYDTEVWATPGERNDICAGDEEIACDEDGAARPARPISPGDIVITEVMVNPTGPSDEEEGLEWFEIYVATSEQFDLNGLAIGKKPDLSDAEPLQINECIPARPDTYLVFAQSDDSDVNGGLPGVDAVYDMTLNQTNSSLVLSYQGTLLDELPYDSATDGAAINVDPDFRTPGLNDWEGFSCDAVDPYGDGDLGTPGAPNINCPDVYPPEGQCFDGTTIRDIAPPTEIGDLVITEILQAPQAPEENSDGEWFEIYANTDFDLLGLSVGRTDTDADDTIETEGSQCASVSAGSYVVIAQEADPAINGGLPQVDGTFNFSLPNTGEHGLWAGGSRDAPLDAITWDSTFSGAASSLDPEATDTVSNDSIDNFCAAVDPYGDGDLGTPGGPNPACGGTPMGTCMDGAAERDVVVPQPGDLVITELMPNPDAVTDANGEWIEILAINAVDLNGLNIGDGPMDGSPARLAGGGECLAVPAGGRAVIAKSADMSMNGGLVDAWVPESGAISLSNSGDQTLSIWIGEDELDVITWSGSTAGAAWTVDADAEDPVLNDDPANWCLASDPYGNGDFGTPGAQGPACGGGMVGDGMCLDGGMPRAIVPPLPGELVINEWMPNPNVVSDTDGEWFEVYVGADVDLNGVELSRITGGMFVLETTLSSPDCMSVSAGSHVVFARDLDVMNNGGLPVADIAFGFSLNNSNSGLAVGIEGVHLDEVAWASSTGGAATKVDPGGQTTAGNDLPGNLCNATTLYGPGDNAGTPGAMNPPC